MSDPNPETQVPDTTTVNTLAKMAYGSPVKDTTQNRLWRLERGNVMRRYGNVAASATQWDNNQLYAKVTTEGLTDAAAVDPSSIGFVKRGSAIRNIAAPNFAFTANSATQVVISWAPYAIRRTDGTATLLAKGQIQIDNLKASTKYYFYPYWAEDGQQIGWVYGGNGTPAIAFTVVSDNAVQKQNQENTISFGAINFTMPASGTSSGDSGGLGGFDNSGAGGRFDIPL